MSKRGQGSCPQCKLTYYNRSKPEKCSSCSYHLGGSYEPRQKSAKVIPVCVKLFSHGDCTFYSCRTVRTHRCLFIIEGNSAQCLQVKCKLAKSTFNNSHIQGNMFSCEHIAKIKEAVAPLSHHSLNGELIQLYKCDDATRVSLLAIMNSVAMPHFIRLTEELFVVYGVPTSSNPVGYCHMSLKDDQLICSSTDCKGYVSAMHQEKNKKICMHCHILFCLQSCFTWPKIVVTSPTPADAANQLPPSLPSSSSSEQSQSVSRTSTIEMNMLNSLPYEIPSSIFHIIATNDSRTYDADKGKPGWPTVFAYTKDKCRLCGNELCVPRPHPGQKAGEVSYLMTNVIAFKPIQVLVKFCCNSNCKAMHQVFPFDLGLFNISDKLLVSLDILLELREYFKRGVPLTVAIESKLSVLVLKSKEPVPALDYITDLLYNGFYCFEILTDRSLDDQICGICGITGEIYLGDGNQKNCCSRGEISYDPDNSELPDGHPLSLDEFLQKLKRHFIELNSYTRAAKLSFHVSEIPPVVAPKLSGGSVWNTEMSKKSQFLTKQSKAVEGDPALLHAMIRDHGLDMSSIGKLSVDEVKKFAQTVGIPTSRKSRQGLLGDIQQLYATLLVGNCPCHGFTKVAGHTGGFYHIVCRHGATVISKPLALQESVRDATDLYLSLKYPPILFICDTPCGFVRHLDCRSPAVSEKLWGTFSGCFEFPDKEKLPSQGINAPQIVPSEYLDKPVRIIDKADESMVHPVSGESRRYVLGDRFHSASNPHKSPLCAYHDINLCLQSNTITTSMVESENNRKNIRRLRSACVQNFGVHFLYNYLMDFYQNEQIVHSQLSYLKKHFQGTGEIVRDKFMRFTFVPSLAS